MKPNKKMPLFIITGASGVGKSTACEILFNDESEYIVMESDLLWHDIYNTPNDNYKKYRELWLRVCANISQIGKPTVLCGCAIPEQFDVCIEKVYFTKIHYLAIVCDEKVLVERMKLGRKISDDNWIKSSIDFNQWLINNGESHNIHLLDSSSFSADQTAKEIDKWILRNINQFILAENALD